MRHWRWLTAILALSLTGCVLRGKQQAKLPAVPPPPPQPAQGPSPAPRPEPLSIPQTQAQLPPAQPIDPEALATVQPPSPRVEAQTAPRPRPRPARPEPAASATPTAPAAQAATPVAAPQPAPPAEGVEVHAQVQEILAPEELKHLQDLVSTQRQEVHRVIDPTVGRKLTPKQSDAVSRIQSFLQQLEDAVNRGDWRQANVLGEKALILAREFQGAVK